MKNLFQSEAVDEVILRVNTLHPSKQHLWGKMDVAQMMAHCSAALDMASGRLILPRLFIGRVFGPFVRPIYSNDKPFSRGNPTDPKLVVGRSTGFRARTSSAQGEDSRVSRGRRGEVHAASASILRNVDAARVEHGNVQTPGSSPAAVRRVSSENDGSKAS
jgi:hypothetical protein